MGSDEGILPSSFPSHTVASMIRRGWLAINDGYRVKLLELGAEGIPFVRGGDIGNGWISTNVVDHVLPAFHAKIATKLTQPGDVAFITKGTVGRVGRLRDDQPIVVFAPQVCYWRSIDNNALSSGYLFYLLQSRWFQAQLNGVMTSGSMAADYVSLRDQQHFRLPIPSIHEQRRIAAVLGALDDKIELNRKMNRTLEEMAQALFKSWFIDFDGVPPSDLVDSELGPIPKGWRWVPFAEVGQWVSGGTPSKKRDDYWGGDIPWFSAKSLGPLWLHESEDRVTAAGADHGTRRVPLRSVLFIVRGMSLATEWRIGITAREATLNQDLKAIVDNGTVLPELVLLWLLTNRELIRAQADEAGHGTKRLPTEVLHAHSLAMPARKQQETMAKPLLSLLQRVELNLREEKTLAELRDTLLPKLISGELRVPDAEALVERETA